MLLSSLRHTAADLALWAELEEADRIHGERLALTAKVEKSLMVMGEFAASGSCYVAVSWGKDSTVLAHLHERSNLHLPVANVAQHGVGYDSHIPDVRDTFLKLFPRTNYREEVVPLEPTRDDGGHSPALDIGIRRLQDYFGTKRYIGGIRADESGVRKIGMRTRGLTTESTCQPLGWWTVADVFGYLAHHNLPVHPAYAMLGGGRWKREHIRVSIIGGPKGSQFGRREWEQEYYGDVLRRLEQKEKESREQPEQVLQEGWIE